MSSDHPSASPTPTVALRAVAEYFTAEHLDHRRRAMARYAGWQGVDALNPKAAADFIEIVMGLSERLLPLFHRG